MNAEQKNSYLNVSITVNLGSIEAWEVCFPTFRHSVFAKLGSLSYAKETQQPVCGVAVWALSRGRLHRLHKGCGQPEWARWHFDPFPPKPHTHTLNLTIRRNQVRWWGHLGEYFPKATLEVKSGWSFMKVQLMRRPWDPPFWLPTAFSKTSSARGGEGEYQEIRPALA